MRFRLPAIFTGLRALPALYGHTGSTGSRLFFEPGSGLVLCGSADDAARVLFAERGYRNITIDDVAAAVGMARTTLYDYYKSKEEILYALVERNLVFSADEPPPGRLAERLRHTMAGSIGRLRRDFDLYRVLEDWPDEPAG